MTQRCEPLETLVDAAARPLGDPRRDHVDGCARCRARLAAYRAFMSADDTHAGSDVGDAQRRLAAALESRLRAGAASRSRPVSFMTSRVAVGVLAMAAVLTLMVVVPRITSVGDAPDAAPTLRGEDQADGLAPRSVRRDDGSWLLTWRPLADADDYEIVLFDAELAEVGRVRTGGRSDWILATADPSPALWRVAALRDGDPLSVSRAHPLGGAAGH